MNLFSFFEVLDISTLKIVIKITTKTVFLNRKFISLLSFILHFILQKCLIYTNFGNNVSYNMNEDRSLSEFSLIRSFVGMNTFSHGRARLNVNFPYFFSFKWNECDYHMIVYWKLCGKNLDNYSSLSNDQIIKHNLENVRY